MPETKAPIDAKRRTAASSVGICEALQRAWAVFAKDLKSEFRSRFAVNAILLFAVTTLLAVSFSVGGVGFDRTVAASLLWIIIYFSALSGLSRVFVREEESRTSAALKLSAAPGVVLAGKMLFNLALIFALEIIVVPLFLGMMDIKIGVWPLFVTILIVGGAGIAVGSTIVAAMVSMTAVRGALFAALSFPVLLPVLIGSISGTEIALGASAYSEGIQQVKLLVSYAGIMSVVSFALFRFIWED